MTARGQVMTVAGPVPATDLGICLPHEHLFLDLRNQFSPTGDPALDDAPVGPATLPCLANNPYAVRDNLFLDDFETAVAEVEACRRLGVRTIIECTSMGIARRPLALRELARRTGVRIVAGCGYYTADTHPDGFGDRPAAAIAREMVNDLSAGIGDTDVRAGVIGEIGTSDPVRPGEWRALEAAALAWAAVPVPIYVHTYPWATHGVAVARFLMDAGVTPNAIVICHVDVEPDLDYIRELLSMGVVVEFDNFGKEYRIDPAHRGFAGGMFITDAERVAIMAHLVAGGWQRQLLITNDICLKNMLCAYGGAGYGHILADVVPMLRASGVDAAAVDDLLIHNPRRLFADI